MICKDCGSKDIVTFSQEDEAGHAEEWDECRSCGSENIKEEE